ncbi:MAG: mechanosensitive ion channel family protein [Polyangiaceae bacterium]|nr:mechanosensitive ion channel family protein [Polyangiaceae bacterium]
MNWEFLNEHWLLWTVAITLVFPALAIIFGELSERFEQRKSALARPLQELRNRVLPALALLLFLRFVLVWDWSSTTIRVVATLTFVLGLSTVLAIFNGALFQEAQESSWRSRVPSLFLDLARFVVVLVGLSVVLSKVWGADLAGLLTALGVGSIVIGLALQDTLSNIFAGIAILFERPFKEGDWIHFEGHFGQVTSITWRSTRMLAHLGDTVVIPNSKIASAVVINENNIVSPRYETIEVGFSYNDPPNRVKDILLKTVCSTELVLPDPPPQVYTKGYGDSCIDYQIRFAVLDIADLFSTKDKIVTRIWYAANRHGLNIPFPIRTVYNYDGPEVEREAEQELQKESADTLSSLLAFADKKELPAKVSLERFGFGERISHPGDAERCLRIIVSGNVSVKEFLQDSWVELLRLGAGEVFGAESVLRNKPIERSLFAATDVVAVKLERSLVMELVSSKAAFAQQMEEILEIRKSALEASRNRVREPEQVKESNISKAELFGASGEDI